MSHQTEAISTAAFFSQQSISYYGLKLPNDIDMIIGVMMVTVWGRSLLASYFCPSCKVRCPREEFLTGHLQQDDC